jgi:hypothetical protein
MVSFCSVFVAKLNEGNTKVSQRNGVIARVCHRCHRCHPLGCFASKCVFGNKLRRSAIFLDRIASSGCSLSDNRLCKNMKTLRAKRPFVAGRRKSMACAGTASASARPSMRQNSLLMFWIVHHFVQSILESSRLMTVLNCSKTHDGKQSLSF